MFATLIFMVLQLLKAAVQPEVGRFVPAEHTSDPAIEAVLRQHLLEPDFQAEYAYYFNRVDLDHDGQPDVIAYLVGSNLSVCGTGGCSLFILKKDRNGYKEVTAIEGCQVPVVVSTTRTNGWDDLLVWLRGEFDATGERQSFYVQLKSNGRSYPSFSGNGAKLTTRIKGTAYMSDYSGLRGGIPITHEKRANKTLQPPSGAPR